MTRQFLILFFLLTYLAPFAQADELDEVIHYLVAAKEQLLEKESESFARKANLQEDSFVLKEFFVPVAGFQQNPVYRRAEAGAIEVGTQYFSEYVGPSFSVRLLRPGGLRKAREINPLLSLKRIYRKASLRQTLTIGGYPGVYLDITGGQSRGLILELGRGGFLVVKANEPLKIESIKGFVEKLKVVRLRDLLAS